MIRSTQHSSNLQASSWRNALQVLVVWLGVVVLLGGGSKAWGQVSTYSYVTDAGTYTSLGTQGTQILGKEAD